MIKVRLLTIYASPTQNADAGSIISLPEKEANDLIRAGYAVAYKGGAVIENAKAGKGETATIKTGNSNAADAELEALRLDEIADELENEAKEAKYGDRAKAFKKAKEARAVADKAREVADELKADTSGK